MKKPFLPTLLLAVIFASCTNADPKAMASELCECVQLKKQVSTKAKKIIIKAARSSDFQSALEEELAAIENETELQEISDDIQSVATAFDENKVQDCAAEVDKKHRVSKRDEKKIQQRLVEEMENLDDCAVYAAFIRVGLREEEKKNAGTDDETGEATLPENKPAKAEQE